MLISRCGSCIIIPKGLPGRESDLKDHIIQGKEKHYFFNTQKDSSGNGLTVIRMGETFPSPDYYVERTPRILRSFGGVFVLEYVIGGEGYIECEGETYHVASGDFYFLNRGYSHRYFSDKRNPMHKIWLNAAGPFVAGIVSALGIGEPVFIAHYDAEPLFRKMQRTLSSIDYSNRFLVYDRVALIVTEMLLGAAAAKRDENAAERDIVYEVKRFIDAGTNPGTTLDEICTRFLQNKSYLIFRFRREFGITPHRYLLRRKMDAAKDLLTTSPMPIKEISELLGFANPQYFSSAFRRATGMTPGEYRGSPNKKNQEFNDEP